MAPSVLDVAICSWRLCLHLLVHRDPFRTSESYPLPRRLNTSVELIRVSAVVLATVGLVSCSANKTDAPPPTIVPARAAQSPAVTGEPAGVVRPLAGDAEATVFDPATASLAVLSPSVGGQSTITVLPASGVSRPVPLPGPATAMTGDNDGRIYASTRGGYFRVDIRAGTASRVDIEGQPGTDFTAITRRADGNLVLGSADGAVYTLSSDTGVGASLKIFSRVDALVAQGNTVVVLDRGQTSVTTISASGNDADHALRAGEGATTMAADSAGRVLVADTRGDELLVFGTDPLILRQRSPVRDAPYGLAASSKLAWVSQTAINSVVGYDLATGIPVEKVRYRTVQQPNSLAFDEASGTLYVVSGSGAGVQVIPNAGVGP
jgi:hypothetical protein